MDQELFAYLEEFRQQMNEQIGGLREETRQRLERLDARVGQNSQELEALREEIRHTQILVEDGRNETRLLAEGMMGLDHKLGTSQIGIHQKLDELRTLVTPLYRRIDERVSHLEAREEEKTRDVMEVIRERYGMPQAR